MLAAVVAALAIYYSCRVGLALASLYIEPTRRYVEWWALRLIVVARMSRYLRQRLLRGSPAAVLIIAPIITANCMLVEVQFGNGAKGCVCSERSSDLWRHPALRLYLLSAAVFAVPMFFVAFSTYKRVEDMSSHEAGNTPGIGNLRQGRFSGNGAFYARPYTLLYPSSAYMSRSRLLFGCSKSSDICRSVIFSFAALLPPSLIGR